MELLSGPVKYDFVICTYDFVAQSYAQTELWPKWVELLNIHGYEEASRKPRMRRFARCTSPAKLLTSLFIQTSTENSRKA